MLPEADREVVLVLGAPETVVTYTVSASPAMLDVHLNVDTTASFVEEIAAIQDSLTRTVIPAIRAIVPNSSFGASYFQDFPRAPFGGTDDRPFVLLQRVTSSLTAVDAAVSHLDDRIGYGGDVPESGYESLYQAATGAGYTSSGDPIIPPFSGTAATGGGTVGGVGFRDDSFKVIVHATDALSHDADAYDGAFDGTHGSAAAIEALVDQSIRVIGVATSGYPRNQLTDLALATGATVPPTGGSCPTGLMGSANSAVGGVCPLVFDVAGDGTGLSTALVDSITQLIANVTFASATGVASDDRLGFIDAIEASSAVAPIGSTPPTTTDGTPGDGYPDTFVTVPSGTALTFRVHLSNTIFAAQTYEQTFRIRVRIVADASVVVDEWIRVVIPALP